MCIRFILTVFRGSVLPKMFCFSIAMYEKYQLQMTYVKRNELFVEVRGVMVGQLHG